MKQSTQVTTHSQAVTAACPFARRSPRMQHEFAVVNHSAAADDSTITQCSIVSFIGHRISVKRLPIHRGVDADEKQQQTRKNHLFFVNGLDGAENIPFRSSVLRTNFEWLLAAVTKTR
jgi:hypothetical protein